MNYILHERVNIKSIFVEVYQCSDLLKLETCIRRIYYTVMEDLREIRLLRSMDHENVIDMMDVFAADSDASTLSDVFVHLILIFFSSSSNE